MSGTSDFVYHNKTGRLKELKPRCMRQNCGNSSIIDNEEIINELVYRIAFRNVYSLGPLFRCRGQVERYGNTLGFGVADA